MYQKTRYKHLFNFNKKALLASFVGCMLVFSLANSQEKHTFSELIANINDTSDIHIHYVLGEAPLLEQEISILSIDQLLDLIDKTSFEIVYLDNLIFILPRTDGSSKSPKADVQYKIQGVVINEETNELVPNAIVMVRDTEISAVSDLDGKFDLVLKQGKYALVVKSVNTIDRLINIDLVQDTTINLDLFSKVTTLNDVVIKAEAADANIQKVSGGEVRMNLETIRKLPTFLGEVDISKIILSLPGLTTVGEGATGFNVRGGNIDQNLILLDNIPIYNSSHLFGFFSIFNPLIVSDFTLYKGNTPASYGGRVSSVFDVNTRNPDKQKTKFSGSVGPVTGKLSLEVPVKEGKAGVSLGARYASPTWVLGLSSNEDIRNSAANYYDINVKYHHLLNDKNGITLSAYISQDKFQFSNDSTYQYFTRAGSMVWDHDFSKFMYSQLTLYATQYKARLNDNTSSSEFEFNNGISKVGANYHLTLNKSFGELKLGFDSGISTYKLGQLAPANSSEIEPLNVNEEQSLDLSPFIDWKKKIGSRLIVRAGARMSTFSKIGPATLYTFDPDEIRSEGAIVDTLITANNNIISTTYSFEPRFSFNYIINGQLSFKGGYSRNRQFEYLFSNSTASLPTDVWKPIDNNIKPQLVDQFSIGLFKNFKDNLYELSLELYRKNIHTSYDILIGSEILLVEPLFTDLIEVEGFGEGIEFYASKKSGLFSGWVSYTLSRVRFRSKSTEINNGDYYPASFDSPHNISVVANVSLGRLWTASGNFIYKSGRPITIPTSSFVFNDVRGFVINDRNNFRIPATHRLDVSLTFEGRNKRNAKWDHSFTLSVYNIYGRKNPFAIYSRTIEATRPKFFQLSVLGSAFPSLTYNFKLK